MPKRKTSVKIADDWLRRLLEALYRNRNLTRQQLSAITGLNAASVSHGLRHLLSSGVLLRMDEKPPGSRRRREVFHLNSEVGYFIAVDLEGDRIRFGLTNFLGDVRRRWEAPLAFRQPLEPEIVIDGIRKVSRDSDESRMRRILAVGISYPGMLDTEGRLIAVNLGWTRCPLVKALNEAFPWPVFLESDKDTCVLAERWVGAARHHANALFLIAEGGIGLGVLADGKPLRGVSGIAGEIGHWKILPEAQDVCNCGQTGCLEAIASSPNIVRQYVEGSGQKASSTSLRIADVFERARRQDRVACAVLERVGRALGLALSHAITLLNPEVVILGGDLIGGEDVLVPIIRGEIERRALAVSLEGVRIAVSSLGLDIRLKGAAALAFRRMIETPQLLQTIVAPVPPKNDRPSDRAAEGISSPGMGRPLLD